MMKKITGRKSMPGERMTNKNRTKMLRLIALILAGAMVWSVKNESFAQFMGNNDKGAAYVGTVKNDRDAKLYNKDGEVIDSFKGNDGIINPVVSTNNFDGNSERINVFVRDDDGDIVKGYMDRSDISQKDVTKIKDFFDGIVNIGVVSAPSGAFARQEKIVDTNTDEAELLEQGTYVLCGVPETSKDNAYTWMKIAYFKNGEDIKIAYMVDEYLLNVEDLEQYRKLTVTCDFLRVRKNPTTKEKDNIQYKLKEGDNVYVIPNVSGKVDEDYDWLAVAYKNNETNEIEMGWIAVTDRKNDKVYAEEEGQIEEEEIEEVEKDEEIMEKPVLNDEMDTKIEMVVNTSSANSVDLKLRESPGIDSNIKMKLQNGTTVYTTKRNISESVEKDGFIWVKVITENGTEGYVADKYIGDSERESNTKKIEYRKMNVPGVGNIEGVLIIDSETLSIGDLEEIFKGNVELPGEYGNKPVGMMIKIGATGYGNKFNLAEPEEKIKRARELMTFCEKNGIPYGTFYYTQAYTEEEQKAEIQHIINVYDGMGELKYNVLGLAIDIENGNSRMQRYASKSEENRQKVTELKKTMMEELRERTGQEVIIYSNKNELKTIIDYTKLSEDDLRRMWLVNEVGTSHPDGLKAMGILEDSSFWQVMLDEPIPNYGGVDINVMTLERFKEIIKAAGLEDEIKLVENVQEAER